MAVMTRFIVVRNGVELEKAFSVKREAEAYDKMLDAAESLSGFIKSSELNVEIEDATIDAVAIHLAKNGPEVVKILKGIRPVLPPSESINISSASKSVQTKDKKTPKPGAPKRRSK